MQVPNRRRCADGSSGAATRDHVGRPECHRTDPDPGDRQRFRRGFRGAFGVIGSPRPPARPASLNDNPLTAPFRNRHGSIPNKRDNRAIRFCSEPNARSADHSRRRDRPRSGPLLASMKFDNRIAQDHLRRRLPPWPIRGNDTRLARIRTPTRRSEQGQTKQHGAPHWGL